MSKLGAHAIVQLVEAPFAAADVATGKRCRAARGVAATVIGTVVVG
jgi:hypothetical protein